MSLEITILKDTHVSLPTKQCNLRNEPVSLLDNISCENHSSNSIQFCNIYDEHQNKSDHFLMQTYPVLNSYRQSRIYRHFKNPPQPHMCIRTKTLNGEELFINVLSWTRIVIPKEPSDPIPLYGGMRVSSNNVRSPPIIFAVMANPEVLKYSGRHSKDPEERRAMIELMCDFVEAMNPDVKLLRTAVILKDHDISGELKDIWVAVQIQRDREREEQMIQIRQQNCTNVTTQQMFPRSSAVKISNKKVENQIKKDENRLSAFDSVLDEEQNAYKILSNDKISKNLEKNDKTELNIEKYVNTENGESMNYKDSAKLESNFIDSKNNGFPSSETPYASEISSTAVKKSEMTVQQTKKEKLGSFLPNSCIFPRFKNSKQKQKEKELKNNDNVHLENDKEKDKTLLNAVKKSKDKQMIPIARMHKLINDTEIITQIKKDCFSLETEMKNLDVSNSFY